MYLFKKNKQKKQLFIEKQDLDATFRTIKARLLPITFFFGLFILIVSIYPIVVSAFGWGEQLEYWPWLTKEFPDYLNKWGGVLQGTIGVAATIVGAGVTVHIANLALEISKNTVEITKAEQRREAEKYAREIKVELVRFGRDLGRSFKALEVAFCDATRVFARDYYLARIILRYEILEKYAGSPRDLSDLEAAPNYFDEEAKNISKLFRDAADKVGVVMDGEWYPDHHASESFANYANRIEKASSSRGSQATSFSEATGIDAWIDNSRQTAKEALLNFVNLLSEIDSKGFVSDLIYGEKAAEEGAGWLICRANALVKILDNKDAYLERLGRAQVISEMSIRNCSFGSIDDRVGIEETLRLSLLCSFFSQSPYLDQFNAYQDTLRVCETNRHCLNLFSALTAGKEKIAGLFSLDVSGDKSLIPQSLINYKPSEILVDLEGTLTEILPLMSENEKLRTEDAALPCDNPVFRFDKSLQYWRSIALNRLYGDLEENY